MKNSLPLLLLFLASALGSCASTSSTLSIPAQKSIEIDYPEFEHYNAELKNKSIKSLEVKVLDKQTNDQVRGFGLGVKANEVVMVEQGSKLVLKNTSNTAIAVKVKYAEAHKAVTPPTDTYISFSLMNPSSKSIPLIIPTVMNPNLSPNSRSGVDLKVGQEIFFRENGKKHVLLVVDENIKDGDRLDVAKLLQERRKELDLSK